MDKGYIIKSSIKNYIIFFSYLMDLEFLKIQIKNKLIRGIEI